MYIVNFLVYTIHVDVCVWVRVSEHVHVCVCVYGCGWVSMSMCVCSCMKLVTDSMYFWCSQSCQVMIQLLSSHCPSSPPPFFPSSFPPFPPSSLQEVLREAEERERAAKARQKATHPPPSSTSESRSSERVGTVAETTNL